MRHRRRADIDEALALFPKLAQRVASHAYVMDRGTVAMHGPSAEVRDDPRLLTYLAP